MALLLLWPVALIYKFDDGRASSLDGLVVLDRIAAVVPLFLILVYLRP